MTDNASSDVVALEQLAAIAGEVAELWLIAEIRQLLARIREGRFFVACVGQFKRGKSTLLDAIVGEPVLPTGVVPVTAVPTVLRYGTSRAGRVLIDGEWQEIALAELSQFVSEELNPENSKQVEGVEVFLPSPLLANGMCLVDTPGIGSVFAGNTETTKKFIPQIDAAILVIGADPPISGEELALIEAVSANVDDILLVLNKIDRVTEAERREASEFATKITAGRLKKTIGPVYEVSALNRLNGSRLADDWDALVGNLSQLAERSRQAMTHGAAQRGIKRFRSCLQRSLDERARALTEPISASEERVTKLRQTVAHAEQSLRDLGALFSSEQMRLSATLLARRKEFFSQVMPVARRELEAESDSIHSWFGPRRRRELMAAAQRVARRHMMPWLDSEEAHSEDLYRGVTQRFVILTNDLLKRMSEGDGDDFSNLPQVLDGEHGFSTRSRFFFHDMITVARPSSPLLYTIDVVMGAVRIGRWFRRNSLQFLEQLIDTNASRVQGDVEQRVVQGRLRLESDVRRVLREVRVSAEHALEKAREVSAAGNDAIRTELARMARLQDELGQVSAWPTQAQTSVREHEFGE